ncbi:MAG TPA: cytidylate kinase-like family protein [Mycobacteriales bacterium]|nr:cytidylate kinase-like family protein [Mycobacteriales bacterium]
MSSADDDQQLPPPVVTLAARYGAGGTYVGPRVAERLGVMFLDRVIDASVAERSGLPEDVVTSYEQKPRAGVSRLIATLSRVAPLDGPPVQVWDKDEGRMRAEVEAFLAEASVTGGVILGRGANFVLRNVVPGVLCVLLTGPREARVEQAMRLRGVDRTTAERELDVQDAARLGYVRRNYGAEHEEATDYHVCFDTTVLDLDTVVDTIAHLSTARRRHAVTARS